MSLVYFHQWLYLLWFDFVCQWLAMIQQPISCTFLDFIILQLKTQDVIQKKEVVAMLTYNTECNRNCFNYTEACCIYGFSYWLWELWNLYVTSSSKHLGYKKVEMALNLFFHPEHKYFKPNCKGFELLLHCISLSISMYILLWGKNMALILTLNAPHSPQFQIWSIF